MKKYLFLLAMSCLGAGFLAGCGGGGNNNNNAAASCATQPGTTWNGSSCVYSGYGTTGVAGQTACVGSCGTPGLVQVAPQYGSCVPAWQGNPCVGNFNGQPVQSIVSTGQYGNGQYGNVGTYPGAGYPGTYGGGSGGWWGGGQQYGYGVYPYPTSYYPYYGRGNNINWNISF